MTSASTKRTEICVVLVVFITVNIIKHAAIITQPYSMFIIECFYVCLLYGALLEFLFSFYITMK